jgi:uncharacterized protein
MPAKCPRCGKELEAANNSFRPFCSERCKLIDLGTWLSGIYRVPAQNEDEDNGGENSEPE